MSKPKTPGYRQKREWLAARFAEGLRIKNYPMHRLDIRPLSSTIPTWL